MPPLDPLKIKKVLDELNEPGKPGAPNWIQGEGTMAVISVSNDKDGKISFNPNLGVPLKLFANARTGEVKLYDARAFFS